MKRSKCIYSFKNSGSNLPIFEEPKNLHQNRWLGKFNISDLIYLLPVDYNRTENLLILQDYNFDKELWSKNFQEDKKSHKEQILSELGKYFIQDNDTAQLTCNHVDIPTKIYEYAFPLVSDAGIQNYFCSEPSDYIVNLPAFVKNFKKYVATVLVNYNDCGKNIFNLIFPDCISAHLNGMSVGKSHIAKYVDNINEKYFNFIQNPQLKINLLLELEIKLSFLLYLCHNVLNTSNKPANYFFKLSTEFFQAISCWNIVSNSKNRSKTLHNFILFYVAVYAKTGCTLYFLSEQNQNNLELSRAKFLFLNHVFFLNPRCITASLLKLVACISEAKAKYIFCSTCYSNNLKLPTTFATLFHTNRALIQFLLSENRLVYFIHFLFFVNLRNSLQIFCFLEDLYLNKHISAEKKRLYCSNLYLKKLALLFEYYQECLFDPSNAPPKENNFFSYGFVYFCFLFLTQNIDVEVTGNRNIDISILQTKFVVYQIFNLKSADRVLISFSVFACDPKDDVTFLCASVCKAIDLVFDRLTEIAQLKIYRQFVIFLANMVVQTTASCDKKRKDFCAFLMQVNQYTGSKNIAEIFRILLDNNLPDFKSLKIALAHIDS